MGPSNSSLLSFRVIFHFHDFWRKDNWVIYHLESRWRNSHVLVYHSPLLSHLLGVAPSTFTTVYIIRSTKHTSKKKHKTLHKERCFVRNLPFKLPMFGYLWDSQADGVSENSSPSWNLQLAPENAWLGGEFPFWDGLFSGARLVLGGSGTSYTRKSFTWNLHK